MLKTENYCRREFFVEPDQQQARREGKQETQWQGGASQSWQGVVGVVAAVRGGLGKGMTLRNQILLLPE